MAKLKGLGRGLDALLGTDGLPAAGDTLLNVAVDALQPGRFQPRARIEQAALAELAESIRAQGVMQPILVRPLATGRYEIVAGERRWRAARLAGLATVPALVREVPDKQALAIALIENIQREDLNPLDQAAGIQRLIQEFGMTHQSAADALGRARSSITNLLRLLELAPPVRELLQQGRLEMGHARALLALPAARQTEVAQRVAARGLSVRETERLVARAPGKSETRKRPKADRDVLRLEEELSQRLGTTVRIRAGAKKGSGKLVISYRTLDQFEAILARL